MIQNAKEELMQCLSEECSEVIKAHSKILRFGESPEKMTHYKEEIADLMAVTKMLFEEWEFTEKEEDEILQLAEKSVKKRISYMKFKPKCAESD